MRYIWQFSFGGLVNLSSSTKLNVRTVYTRAYPYVIWIALVAKLNIGQFASHINPPHFMSAKCTAYTVVPVYINVLKNCISVKCKIHVMLMVYFCIFQYTCRARVYHSFYTQMNEATTSESVQTLAKEHIDIILECGYTKSITALTVDDKEDILKALCLHNIIFKCKAELDQMKEGLRTLGVATALEVLPDTFQCLFTSVEETLTPGNLLIVGDNKN